MMLFPMTLTGP